MLSIWTYAVVALLIAVLPLLLLQQFYVLPAIRQQLRDDRIRAVRQLVETGHGILEAYEARVRAGELTPREAQHRAAAMLEGLRYAIFGLGDHSYHATYSRGGEILDETLRACGAQRVGEFGRHDAAAAIPPHDAARAWAQGAVEELTGVAQALG